MCHLFKFILDMGLELENLVGVFWIFNLLGNFGCFLIHSSLEQALSMVKLVLSNIWIEFSELIIHVGCASIVLDVEITVSEQGKSRAISWTELELVR